MNGEETVVDVEIVLAEQEAQAVLQILDEEGVSEYEETQEADLLPGVIVVVVAVVIGAIALTNVIIKLSRAWSVGVLIDARGEMVRTEKKPDLPRGTVLVLGRDGDTHTLHEPTEAELGTVIAAAVGA